MCSSNNSESTSFLRTSLSSRASIFCFAYIVASTIRPRRFSGVGSGQPIGTSTRAPPTIDLDILECGFRCLAWRREARRVRLIHRRHYPDAPEVTLAIGDWEYDADTMELWIFDRVEERGGSFGEEQVIQVTPPAQ